MDKKVVERNRKKRLGGGNLLPDVRNSKMNETLENFFFGEVLERKALTDNEKAIVLLASLTSLGDREGVKSLVENSLDFDFPPELILETIYQTTPYIGLSKVREALEATEEVFDEKGLSQEIKDLGTTSEEDRFEKGLAVQKEIFGGENIESMRENAPKSQAHIQDYLSAYCFGDFYTRDGLDLGLRELITFVSLASLGGCDPQMQAHAGANINVGNSKEKLIEAVSLIVPLIGFPRSLNALSAINSLE